MVPEHLYILDLQVCISYASLPVSGGRRQVALDFLQGARLDACIGGGVWVFYVGRFKVDELYQGAPNVCPTPWHSWINKIKNYIESNAFRSVTIKWFECLTDDVKAMCSSPSIDLTPFGKILINVCLI